MVLWFERSEVSKALSDRAIGVLSACLLSVAACSKRGPTAPKPEQPEVVSPAATASVQQPAKVEQQRPADEKSVEEEDSAWPGAINRTASESAAPPSEKKREGSASRGAGRAESERDVRPKKAATPQAAAAAKPGPVAKESADADDTELAEWGRSVALLDQTFANFENALELSVPDCVSAEKFRQAVCTLAERICSLEAQVPNTAEQRCTDGRQRCEQAGQKYRARCENE